MLQPVGGAYISVYTWVKKDSRGYLFSHQLRVSDQPAGSHGSGAGRPPTALAGLTTKQLAAWSTPGPRAHDRLAFKIVWRPPTISASQMDAGSLFSECAVLSPAPRHRVALLGKVQDMCARSLWMRMLASLTVRTWLRKKAPPAGAGRGLCVRAGVVMVSLT
jgi:hypothetical protein